MESRREGVGQLCTGEISPSVVCVVVFEADTDARGIAQAPVVIAVHDLAAVDTASPWLVALAFKAVQRVTDAAWGGCLCGRCLCSLRGVGV